MSLWLKKSLLVPEVVQTSGMDCGPASLKCLLEGFGINVSYGRLREACQTDVDGTSIDTMESVAGQLGLDVEQVMIPADHLLLPETAALPAIVVVRLPNGNTHFAVAWRKHGNIIQVMDPATGRRWPTAQRFLDELYIHQMNVPAAAWREYAGSEDFLAGLRRRLKLLSVSRSKIESLITHALSDPGWRAIAALDAATRSVAAIVRTGEISAGRRAARVIEAFYQRERETGGSEELIPANYWSVRAAPPDADGEEQLTLKGAVLVRARGIRAHTKLSADEAEQAPPPLSPELVAALNEKASKPLREFLKLLFASGFAAPLAALFALIIAASAVVAEALFFRGIFELGRELVLPEQRLGAIIALAVFVSALLLLELPLINALFRIGRHLEARLRVAFLEKIPRLGDRYFQSRLISDMAERCHSTPQLRTIPNMVKNLLRPIFEMAFTLAGIAWIDWQSFPIALTISLAAIFVPLLAQPVLGERNLKVKTHGGALYRFYLDALLGLVTVKAHGAERPVRREHESLLVEWLKANLSYQRAIILIESVQSLLCFGFALWLLFTRVLVVEANGGGALLLVFWLLNLPVLGQEIALMARLYPSLRTTILRLLEPLGAPEEPGSEIVPETDTVSERAGAASIVMEDVTVRAAGHTILSNVDCVIEAGSHIAVVGPSGAGKSSLVGLLLGWHRPASGQILVDGELLDSAVLARLRQQTAWVDPAVQLWNRSLIQNLSYGTRADALNYVSQAVAQADLHRVIERLPEGLQSPLGESGALVSGGEGQRVRLGRAMLRADARLVILDEPFRGLDRPRRRQLLERARKIWRNATLICITHDVGETTGFERVLVIDNGRIVEDDRPERLLADESSRYRALMSAEDEVRDAFWDRPIWRRFRIEGGEVEIYDDVELTELLAEEEAVMLSGVVDESGKREMLLSARTDMPAPAGDAQHPLRSATNDTPVQENSNYGSKPHPLDNYCWPVERLGEAIATLARRSDLPVGRSEPAAPPAELTRADNYILSQWIESTAVSIGIEAEPVEMTFGELDESLKIACPALLRLPGAGTPRFITILHARGEKIAVLGPDRKLHYFKAAIVSSAMRAELEAKFRASTEQLLREAGIPARRMARAGGAILRERLTAARTRSCWHLRLAPGASLYSQVRDARLPSRFLAFLGSFIVQYLLFVLFWWSIGKGLLSGSVDQGLMIASALLLITTIPIRLAATWLSGILAVSFGGILRQRLLAGIMRLNQEEVRAQGIGQLLGRVIESEAMESFALNGGFMGIVGAIELAFAAIVLYAGAAGLFHLLLLLGWLTITVLFVWRAYRRRSDWTDARLTMSHDLIERMVGHRTRIAQELRAHWHREEDQAVEHYLHLSRNLDGSELAVALIPRGWLAIGILGIAPAFISGATSLTAVAISIGGILLAYRAFSKLASALSDIARAAIAWRQIKPLYQAAARPELIGETSLIMTQAPGSGQTLMEARELSFRYQGRSELVLQHCSFNIQAGDRILLEGPSGGGKSTLAALLTGLRAPSSGLLLARGFDRQTLGDIGWRKLAVAAPQFHENHVMSETFAFNLLMGRRWPPEQKDLTEAEAICRELGLGDLLDRMPGGMMQMVGETGWQLSHGERSRLYMARALLQDAELVVLDESFAALDPESLRQCLHCALTRAKTLLVIAHP